MNEDYKILLVEDEMVIAQDLRIMLENEGHHVVGIATNGKDALKMANRFSPTIVFLDINLSGDLDGIQVAEALKSTRKVNIIYLTSCQDPDTLARAEETKPLRILLKFKRREILETLNQLCSGI